MSVNNLMLVNLSISAWTARKYDKKVSDQVATDHGATGNVGRYNKNLLPFEAASYKAVHDAVTKSRADYYRETMPWLDDGRRALPSMNHLKFAEIMRENRENFDSASITFQQESELLFQRAKTVLNGMYNEKDYPSLYKLRDKFSFSIRFEPVPDGADFRVTELAETDVLAIREELDQAQQAGIKTAIGDLYERLGQVVEHMKGRLAGDKVCNCRACKGRTFTTDEFADTLVTNVREVCDVLPRLNFTQDPQLEEYRKQAVEGLAFFDAETLRTNGAVRNVVRERAEQIFQDMQAVMQVAA